MLAELLESPRSVAASRGPDRAYWRRLLPFLVLLACVTRAPSFIRPLWNPDEGYLAVQARILANGGELYSTVVDRKPPLVPWLYEAAFAVSGSGSLTSVRVLAVVAQLSTAVLLASLARRRWGDRAGRTAAVLYLLVSIGLNPEDAQAATFEVLQWVFLGTAVVSGAVGTYLVLSADSGEPGPSEHARLRREAMSALPETRPFGRFLRRRSAGIRDLRQGSLVDEDWRDRDPDALRAEACTEVALLDGATHCFVTATITRSPRHPLGP